MNVNQLLNDTLEYMQNGDIKSSEVNLKKILIEYPNNTEALLLSGIILIHQKKIKEGKKLIELSLKINPNQPKALLNYGLAYYQQDRFDEAIENFNKAINLKPDYAEAIYCRGLSFKKKKLLEDAINSFRSAINANPKYLDPFINLAYLYFEIRDFEMALPTFQKALEIDPHNYEILGMVGECQNELGMFQDAVKNLEKSLKIFPNQELKMIGLGYSYLKLNNPKESINKFSYVLDHINNKNILALNNRANAYYLIGSYDQAINDLNSLIKINSKIAFAFLTYGNCLLKTGNYEGATKKYLKSIDLDKKDPDAYLNLGILKHQEKKYLDAIENFNKALSLKPKYSMVLNSRGAAFVALKKYELAMNDFNEAIENNPNYAASYSSRAELYDRLKKFDLANIDHKKSIQLNPKNETFKYNFSLHLLNLKNFKCGWSYYKLRFLTWPEYSSFYRYYKQIMSIKKLWRPNNHGAVFILGEQGLGDQILYASMLLDLKETFNDIYVSIDFKLIPLFERSFNGIKFIPTRDNVPLVEHDLGIFKYAILLGDLGEYYRSSIDDFKNKSNVYLKSNSAKKYFFRDKLQVNGKFICGISWKSKNDSIGSDKSLCLYNLAPIFEIENLIFVNLQYGDVVNEIDNLFRDKNIAIKIIKELDLFQDLDSLASLIDACDFVVTTSNINAHIAGGLGKKTFLLAPFSSGKIWYWHEEDKISLWYPSIQIHRQKKDGQWIEPIQGISQILRKKYNE